MNRLNVLIFLLVAFISSSVSLTAQDTLSYWGVNEGSGNITKEKISNTNFTINSKWSVIEWVPGISQTAFRTDGYTSWIDGTTSNLYPVDFFSVSLWQSLETYPVSTAALWSYFDPATLKGAYIAIDKFGHLIVQFNANNSIVNYTSLSTIPHYKWQNIVLNVDAVNGSCKVYLNGVSLIDAIFSAGSLTWPSSTTKTYLGRAAAITTQQNIFPLNFINGILDEIVVRKRILSATEITQEFSLLNPALPPNMATPASRFSNDIYRPKYHAIPNNGWCNESHGLLYYGGTYHLFYQKNGNGPYFSQQNWGHLISNDLLQWSEVQPALFPQPGWESVGTWSGHCVLDNSGVPTIIYTGVDGVKAGIGSAQSTGPLLNWSRNIANPLLPGAPVTPSNRDFRDPYIFKEGNTWYMIVGSGLQSPSLGTVFLYKSTDLVTWQFIDPLFTDQSGVNSPGIFWEMPVFWKFNNKYLLLVNKTPNAGAPARAFYWVGNFSNEKFIPANPASTNLEIINSLLSPSVNVDAQNRVTAIGIIPDLLPPSEQYNHGWANVFSLPRLWQMQNDSLYQSPHPNLDLSRGAYTNLNNITITSSASGFLKVKGFQGEIKATISQGTANKVGFYIYKNSNNSEFTKIYYDYVTKSFVVDRTKSSLNTNTPLDIQTEFFPLPANQPIEWHIYLDGSVIEVFINNKWAFATRAYPQSFNSNISDMFSEGGNASATNVGIWNRGDFTRINDSLPPSGTIQELKVWPVPAKDKLTIQLPDSAGGLIKVSLFDVQGKLMAAKDVNVPAAIKQIDLPFKDISSSIFADGMYFITLKYNNGSIYKKKIVILK